MTTEPNAARERAVDPSRCPLCGEPNGCALTEGRPIESCWCLRTKIPPDARELIPPEQRGRACICKACAKRSNVFSYRS